MGIIIIALLITLGVLALLWLASIVAFLLTPSVARVLDQGLSEGVIRIRGILRRPSKIRREWPEPFIYEVVDRADPRRGILFGSNVNLDKFLGDEVAIKLRWREGHFVFMGFVYGIPVGILISAIIAAMLAGWAFTRRRSG